MPAGASAAWVGERRFWRVPPPATGAEMLSIGALASGTLEKLNQATVAWVERDYHRRDHRDLGTTPIK